MIAHWPDGWDDEDYIEWVKPYSVEELPEHLRKYKKPILSYSYLKAKYQPGYEQLSGPLVALSTCTKKYIDSFTSDLQLHLQVGEWIPESMNAAIGACIYSRIAALSSILKEKAMYEYYWLVYKMIIPMEDVEAMLYGHGEELVFEAIKSRVEVAYSSMLAQAKERESQVLAAFPECANYGLKPILTNIGNAPGEAYQVYLPIQQPNIAWPNLSE